MAEGDSEKRCTVVIASSHGMSRSVACLDERGLQAYYDTHRAPPGRGAVSPADALTAAWDVVVRASPPTAPSLDFVLASIQGLQCPSLQGGTADNSAAATASASRRTNPRRAVTVGIALFCATLAVMAVGLGVPYAFYHIDQHVACRTYKDHLISFVVQVAQGGQVPSLCQQRANASVQVQAYVFHLLGLQRMTPAAASQAFNLLLAWVEGVFGAQAGGCRRARARKSKP